MNGKQVKQIKKMAMDMLGKEMHEKLDKIEKFCQDTLKAQDRRSKNIHSFLIQQVTGKIQNDLFNANCTVEAVVEVLAEAGLNIPDFNQKIDEKKKIIADRKVKEAEAAMKDKLAAQQELAAAAKKAEDEKSEAQSQPESQPEAESSPAST